MSPEQILANFNCPNCGKGPFISSTDYIDHTQGCEQNAPIGESHAHLRCDKCNDGTIVATYEEFFPILADGTEGECHLHEPALKGFSCISCGNRITDPRELLSS